MTSDRGAMHMKARRKMVFWLERVFGVLYVAFSLCLLYCTLDRWQWGRTDILRIIGILCAVILFAVFFAFQSGSIALEKRLLNAVSIFILSLGVNLFMVLLIGQDIEQASDFKYALETAMLDFPLTETIINYRVFSNWAIYPLYLKILQDIFGYGPLTVMISNAVLSAISSALVFALCNLWVRNDRIGYMAALLYTFWPSNMIYVVIMSPEFVNIVLTLAFFVLLGMIMKFCNRKYVYGLVVLAGFDLCLSGFFKSIDKIILIDMCIVLVLLLIKKADFKLPAQHKLSGKLFSLVVVFVLSYLLSNKLIYVGLDYAYGAPLNRNPTAHFICVGLNPETYGTWNEKWGYTRKMS